MVAGVIIAIEALVVFVTMMGSVNARTREIGIFRALGFRRSHVTRLILLIEAGVASAARRHARLPRRHGAQLRAAALLRRGRRRDGVAWAPLPAAGAVLLALLIGSLGSLYPALHASRLDPTVALRAI